MCLLGIKIEHWRVLESWNLSIISKQIFYFFVWITACEEFEKKWLFYISKNVILREFCSILLCLIHKQSDTTKMESNDIQFTIISLSMHIIMFLSQFKYYYFLWQSIISTSRFIGLPSYICLTIVYQDRNNFFH